MAPRIELFLAALGATLASASLASCVGEIGSDDDELDLVSRDVCAANDGDFVGCFQEESADCKFYFCTDTCWPKGTPRDVACSSDAVDAVDAVDPVERCGSHDGDVTACDGERATDCAYYFCAEACHPEGTTLEEVCGSTPPPPEAGPLTPRILAVVINPIEGGTGFYQHFFAASLGGGTVLQGVTNTAQKNIDTLRQISGGTVQYSLARAIEINAFPPSTNGFRHTFATYQQCVNGNGTLPNGKTCEDQKWLVDHVRWTTENRICELAEEHGADEIWLVSGPYVMTYEAFMVGPTIGFGPNGGAYRVPACKQQYIAQGCFGLNDAQPSMHCFGHRVEAAMAQVTDGWNATDRRRYWTDFAITAKYAAPYGSPSPVTGTACGNAHWAANSDSHYDYDNPRTTTFNCPDWRNFPNLTGATTQLDCTAWGCSDAGWGQYWLGSLPNGEGTVSMTSASGLRFDLERNWWSYVADPERAIALRRATGL